jgi:hypothetical protein
MLSWALDPHQTPLLRRSAFLIIRNYLASISKRVATSATANAANAAMEAGDNAAAGQGEMAEGFVLFANLCALNLYSSIKTTVMCLSAFHACECIFRGLQCFYP